MRGQTTRALTYKVNFIKHKYAITTNEQLSSKLTEIRILITNKTKIKKKQEGKVKK